MFIVADLVSLKYVIYQTLEQWRPLAAILPF